MTQAAAFPSGYDEPPEAMDGMTDAARAIWDVVSYELHPRLRWSDLECQRLAFYCEALARARALEEEITRDGATHVRGNVRVRHPRVLQARRAWRSAHRWAALLGIQRLHDAPATPHPTL